MTDVSKDLEPCFDSIETGQAPGIGRAKQSGQSFGLQNKKNAVLVFPYVQGLPGCHAGKIRLPNTENFGRFTNMPIKKGAPQRPPGCISGVDLFHFQI
jgi:hypothetical protein